MPQRPGDGLRIAILGLGEAGGRIASDLVALGADVSAWDPDPERRVEGVRVGSRAGEAVGGAAVVLSVNSGAAAEAAAGDCADSLDRGSLFADLNSASPGVKRVVADLVTPRGALFADVALMAPVPARGIRTPSLVSGPGAESFAARFGALGMPVEVIGPEPGMAAERKLLRSVFMKGLAAAIGESLTAAEAAGCEDWLRGEIASVLDTADAALLDRLVEGSRRHAVRRAEELEAAAELLESLGVEPRMTRSAAAWLAELAGPGSPGG